jgi:hypothetical protein
MLVDRYQRRSSERMPDGQWCATLSRVRSEFDEMPCLRVTADQARVLFGLPGGVTHRVLEILMVDGFLVLTPDGMYVRRNTRP